jgi:hypothetical protein
VLFALDDGELRVAGELGGAFSSMEVGARLFAAGGDALFAYELAAGLPAEAVAEAPLFPLVEDAWLLGDVIAQQRGAALYTWGEREPARVELIARDGDGASAPLGAMSMDGEGRMLRVGELLVGLEPGGLDETDAKSLTVRVFALDDPRAPREVGRLESRELNGCTSWTPRAASVDDEVVAGGKVLVMRVTCDAEGSAPSLGFALIDVSDPERPALRRVQIDGAAAASPVTRYGADSLLLGDVVYLSYPVVVDEDALEQRGDERQRADVYYLLRTLDLSNPSKPELSAAINVPGQVIAADGDIVFTRDARWNGDELQHLVRKVRLEGGRARILASMDSDLRPLSARILADDALAITAFTEPCSYCLEGDSQLLVASSELELLGELPLEGRAVLARSRGDLLVIDAPRRGLQLIDTRNPAVPALQQFLPGTRLSDLRAGELLYVRGIHDGYRWEAGSLGQLSLD